MQSYSKSKGKNLVLFERETSIFLDKVGIDKRFKAFCAEVEYFLTVILLLILCQAILGLSDLEFAFTLKGHQTDTQVGSTLAR